MAKVEKVFVANLEVIGVEETDMKTPAGEAVVKVLFDGGKSEHMTQKTLDLVSTSEATDWEYVRRTKYLPLIHEVCELVGEYDLEMQDIHSFVTGVQRAIEARFSRAMNFLWNGDDSKFNAAIDPALEFKLSEANAVNSKIDEQLDATKETE